MKNKKRATASPWPSQARRRKHDFDVKRVAIMDTAARLFHERGYKETSLNELATALNVTKPTIYYYFANKEEILRAIKNHCHDEFVRNVVEIRASDRRGIDMIAEAMRRYAKILTSDYGRVVVLIHDRVLTSKGRSAVQDRTTEIDSHLYAIYDKALSDGDIRPVERHVIHYTLFGALNWSPYWYNPHGKIPPDKLAEMQISLLLDGLRVRD